MLLLWWLVGFGKALALFKLYLLRYSHSHYYFFTTNSNQPVAINMPPTVDLLLAILACFCPPIVVFIKLGFSPHLLLNIVLFMLAGIPGILHAWYIVLKYPDDSIPYVSEWAARQSFFVPAAPGDERPTYYAVFGRNQNGYQQVTSDLEQQQPQYEQYHEPQQQQHQQQYQPEQQHQQQQQQYQPEQHPSSSSSSNPPPYLPSNFIPGDNKVQYNSM